MTPGAPDPAPDAMGRASGLAVARKLEFPEGGRGEWRCGQAEGGAGMAIGHWVGRIFGRRAARPVGPETELERIRRYQAVLAGLGASRAEQARLWPRPALRVIEGGRPDPDAAPDRTADAPPR